MLDTANYTPRLKAVYMDSIRAALKEEFGYKNEMQIPKLDKIVLNIGCGAEAVKDSKKAKSAQEDLTAIAGQKAVITKAKKSIAGFRVREDMPLGAKVTLRGDRMYEFLDRLITIALPRVRDFRGIPDKNVDDHGNLSVGMREFIAFDPVPVLAATTAPILANYRTANQAEGTLAAGELDKAEGLIRMEDMKDDFYYLDEENSPQFPFGFGLSYTSFEYSDLEVITPEVNLDSGLAVNATITNTGAFAGDGCDACNRASDRPGAARLGADLRRRRQ